MPIKSEKINNKGALMGKLKNDRTSPSLYTIQNLYSLKSGLCKRVQCIDIMYRHNEFEQLSFIDYSKFSIKPETTLLESVQNREPKKI